MKRLFLFALVLLLAFMIGCVILLPSVDAQNQSPANSDLAGIDRAESEETDVESTVPVIADVPSRSETAAVEPAAEFVNDQPEGSKMPAGSDRDMFDESAEDVVVKEAESEAPSADVAQEPTRQVILDVINSINNEGTIRPTSSDSLAITTDDEPEGDSQVADDASSDNAATEGTATVVMPTTETKSDDSAEPKPSEPASTEVAKTGEESAIVIPTGVLGKLGMQMRRGRDSVTVGTLEPNGIAYRSGLRTGDTIISVGRKTVFSTADFKERLGDTEAGQKLKVFVTRDGAWRTANVTIPE